MRCTISCNETHRYPYNFIYKLVLTTATIYPKIRSLTLKLLIKSKNVILSNKFDYIVPCETSLVLMVKRMFIYNIHHS